MKYRTLTFEILFWHSNWGRLSHFDIRHLFWHSKWGRMLYFAIQNPILTFELRPNIVFWHSKSYFDIWTETEYRIWHPKTYLNIRTEAEYRILTFKILLWHSDLGRISYFDIRNHILIIALRWNLVFTVHSDCHAYKQNANLCDCGLGKCEHLWIKYLTAQVNLNLFCYSYVKVLLYRIYPLNAEFLKYTFPSLWIWTHPLLPNRVTVIN